MWKERSPRPDLVLVAFFLLAASVGRAESLYLDEIPVAATGLLASGNGVVRVTLHVRDTAAFAGATPSVPIEIRAESVRFDLPESAQVEGEAGPAHRRSTFVVDFEEPEVRELAKTLGLASGERPSIDRLVRATDRALPQKTRAWGWLVASQAARRGEGDCTEHAVVLTALARLAGWPARVVLGVVLVPQESAVRAFGHAWTEIHDGHRWVRADAMALDPVANERYLRLGSLDDEGPGFGSRLLAFMQALWPKRIELETAAP